MTDEPLDDAPSAEAPRRPVLYVLACGSPVAREVGKLVALAQRRGYDVCVVATPDGRKFLDIPALAAQTGHPVRTSFKNPGDPDVLPPPDALVVAPATVNTVNKWAAGIADTLPLGLLIEGYGKGLPIVAFPYTNDAMARHPMFQENLDRLRRWGVRVLYGDDVLVLPAPGNGDAVRHEFPWELALAAVDELLSHRGVRVGV
ncbi:flavoprotein [Catellatospora sp. TT07R-123]|uniref:flavoprotein n=1 Tax=Catellatospora sp. TT07R-123 TaxID=2733863 RepID=UPI001B0C44D1|nr:flavoprotein [Catellatospora sp. TT07R-123]GHJ49903.1 flavoprotein [Catellatospora sp. TT07R-123]